VVGRAQVAERGGRLEYTRKEEKRKEKKIGENKTRSIF
jgi:hypothetical protein